MSDGPPSLFSRTFFITLDRYLADPDNRVHSTLSHLADNGIGIELFQGFDAERTGLSTIHPEPEHSTPLAPKCVNIALSHINIWKMCLHLDGDSFLILEDDVRFVPGWIDRFNRDMPFLPSTWDFLFLGSCCCGCINQTAVHGDLYRIRHALCTHAYAFRKQAVPVLVRACSRIYTKNDIMLALHAIPLLETYAFLPRLADQLNTIFPP